MKFARLLVVLSLLSLVSACITNPETGKSSFNIIPESTEMQLGAQAFAEVKSTTQESGDVRANRIVQRVAERIIAQTGTDYPWEVRLVESNEANAFVLPGGKIVVYTGILPILENEAGLAFVMGHEVGHAIARHGGQRISVQLGTQVALSLGDVALSDSAYHNEIMQAFGLGTQLGTLKYSRSHESEADYMGIRYMARAGYDPREAPKVWERMAAGRSGQAPPEILSTHPSNETRAQELRDVMDEAMEFYNAAPARYGLGENL